MENIMEHIAFTLKKDPLEVRMVNFIKNGDSIFAVPSLKLKEENPLPKIIEDLKMSADYNDRVKFIDNFNKVRCRQNSDRLFRWWEVFTSRSFLNLCNPFRPTVGRSEECLSFLYDMLCIIQNSLLVCQCTLQVIEFAS
jgi:adenine specific DNA methylase Mod